MSEFLFYGGIGIVVCSVIAFILYFYISRTVKKRLDEDLDKEYGPVEEK
ncbi:MAG: hypothetical protein Q4C91_04230 [Eubacteriales bacterium]|nr:hypothetical protein [Eubacteriales bacterium]